MLGVADAIDRRIAQIDVGRGHVDLQAQDVRAIGMQPALHLLKQREIFLGAALPKRRIPAGLGQRAAMGANLLG